MYEANNQRKENFEIVKKSISDLILFPAIDTVNSYDEVIACPQTLSFATQEYINHNQNIPGKLGCNLSQLYLIEKFKNSPWILVLEDDISVTEYSENYLNDIVTFATEYGAHYVKLITSPYFLKEQKEMPQLSSNIHKMIPQWGADAYLISRDGARILLEHAPLSDNIDHVFNDLIPELNAICAFNNIFSNMGAQHGYDTSSKMGSIINSSKR